MFKLFGLIVNWRSNIAKFWFSKLFFRWKLQKWGINFYYWNILITLIFNVLYFLKTQPNFDVQYQIEPNNLNIFMAVFIDLWPCLFTTKVSYAQLFKWGHSKPKQAPDKDARPNPLFAVPTLPALPYLKCLTSDRNICGFLWSL